MGLPVPRRISSWTSVFYPIHSTWIISEELDGRNPKVKNYVMNSEDSRKFITEFHKLLEFMVPLYRREGKAYLVIAIGCTGGQHRSVTIVGELAELMKQHTDNIIVRHRDVAGGGVKS